MVILPKLMEAVEDVKAVVAQQPSERPPLPPYPELSDLSLDGKQYYEKTLDGICFTDTLLKKPPALLL